MSITPLVTGDDLRLPVQLTINGAVFDASAATIKARVVSLDHATALTPEVAQSSGASGANWSQSLVVVVISAAETAAIASYGMALLEIQAARDIKETWFVPLNIVQGQIA
jgi:hypothetical protein